MSTNIAPTIKKIAMNAVAASNPVSFTFGTVINASPLSIKLDGSLVLNQTDGALILARHVTDYEVDVDPDWETENGGGDNHSHKIKGRKKLKILNGLKIGDTVIMFKVQGGNSYVVFDKVGVLP